LKTENFT